MTPIDRDIIRRKLETITTSLRLLSPIASLDLSSYRVDPYRRKATERLLQEIVEAAVDINAHVLVQSGHAAPDDLFSSFSRAGDLGMLDPDLASDLAPSAGLRNRLVHQYDAIDDALVLAAVSKALELYSRYVAAVESFLRR